MIRRGVGDERGFTLIELLFSMAIFVVVLGAVLTTFEQFVVVNNTTNERQDIQDRARQAVDQLAKEMRNASSPTTVAPQQLDVAGPQDMVVRSVDPSTSPSGTNTTNVRRVRYCLDTSTSPGKLWMQKQTWTTSAVPPLPSTGSCPSGGWTSPTLLSGSVTNESRPVFSYNSATLSDITSLHVELFVDTKAGGPKETQLSSGVFLRNANRRPTATFTWTKASQGIILNGSGSTDPEGDTLTYQWLEGSTVIGNGIAFTWAGASSGNHDITLKVTDSGDLASTTTETVTA